MRSGVRFTAVIAAIAGTAFAATAAAESATASSTSTVRAAAPYAQLIRARFSVLDRHGVRAAAAGTGDRVVALAQGAFTVAVALDANGDVCITAVATGEVGGIGCGHPQQVMADGLMLQTAGVGSPRRMTVLVPNGVTAVTFAGSNAQTAVVAVSSNVATSTLAGVRSVTFALPGGTSETLAVPAKGPAQELPDPAS